MSGVSASTTTEPRSPVTAAAAPPAASVIVPLYELIWRSASLSPSATVYVNTSAAFPVPLAYEAVPELSSVSVGTPETTTASSQVTVIEMASPIL